MATAKQNGIVLELSADEANYLASLLTVVSIDSSMGNALSDALNEGGADSYAYDFTWDEEELVLTVDV